MGSADLKEKMKEFIKTRFEGKASDVFVSRINAIIDGLPDDTSAMSPGLNNVRIAVKLLFDDKLSDDIHEELCLMAKYSDRVR